MIHPFFKRSIQYLAFSCFALGANHALAENLETAVQSAFSTHPSIEAAKAALNVSSEEENEAFSDYFPQLSMSASAGRMYGDNATTRGLSVTRGAGYSNFGEGSIALNQMIFDGKETPNRVEAAKTRKMSAGVSVVDVRESLAYRAVQSYINVLRARKGLELLEEHSKNVDDYMSRIRSMVDQGASDETELQQARDIQVILDGIKADFIGQVQAAEANYAEVVGSMPDGTLAEPTERMDAIVNEIDQALTAAQNTHPAITAAKLQTKASTYDIEAEEGTLYPDVNGELSYLKSDKEDLLGGEIVDARALVRMSWNFSTGGEQLARIRKTKHSHKQSLARELELKRQIERDVRLAYSELETAQTQLKLYKERNELNAKLFSAYESQFEGARVKLLQLMQSHNQLFNTKLEMMNGRYRYIAAQYGVLASMGRLQETLNVGGAAALPDKG